MIGFFLGVHNREGIYYAATTTLSVMMAGVCVLVTLGSAAPLAVAYIDHFLPLLPLLLLPTLLRLLLVVAHLLLLPLQTTILFLTFLELTSDR